VQLNDGDIFADYTVSSSTPSFINITSLQTAIPFLFRGKTIRAWGELWTGSDQFGSSVTLAAGSSKIEPGLTPAHPVTLRRETFTAAASEAGMSRRYGGIYFRGADLAGRLLGRMVAFEAWQKAQGYFDADAPLASATSGTGG
jgi:hypothetical protein